ncbi:GAF domain protein [Prevotella sp. DNF00663]|uniref:GAF domain-containing protein n=1 Tax=Prevotella sp. DNF00663 TaxID=1384078 RepID=UPI00078393F0|nr:GAF domain-containing protein [Prevotella sp. DNF00663]KXB84793.1 GAF domain protein [Prevotella sp. DNF00663]
MTPQYTTLYQQIKSLIANETNVVGVLANVSAALREAFPERFFWVGFYLKVGDGMLKLGPFQGSVACYNIPYGKGVCGTAWKEGRTLVVPDVEAFPGHIACSSLSRSEIVVPMYDSAHQFWGVLDIDSTALADFDEPDQEGLEAIVALVMDEIGDLM